MQVKSLARCNNNLLSANLIKYIEKTNVCYFKVFFNEFVRVQQMANLSSSSNKTIIFKQNVGMGWYSQNTTSEQIKADIFLIYTCLFG